MNGIYSNVGVIGTNYYEVRQKMEQLLSEFDQEIIKHVILNKHDMRIVFKDGGIIRGIVVSKYSDDPCGGYMRGHRFHEIYLDRWFKDSGKLYEWILPLMRQREFYDEESGVVIYEHGFGNYDWRYHVKWF